MLKRDYTGWLLAILGLLIGATVLIYAGIETAEQRSHQAKVKPDPKVDHLKKGFELIPNVEMATVFRKSDLPASDITCEFVIYSEYLLGVDISDADIIHSLNGEALRKELLHRLESAKGVKGSPVKKIGLYISNLEEHYKPKQEVEIELYLSGDGTQTFTGPRASLDVAWGAFKVPWQKRAVVEPPADELKTIAAREDRKYSITIPAPEKPGEYSLYAEYDLYANEAGDAWVTQSVRSATKVLRVVK